MMVQGVINLKDCYRLLTGICLLLTFGTIVAILLSLFVYPFKLAIHRYRVNKINKEFPGGGPIITSRFTSDYLELKTPIFKDFFQWFFNTKFTYKVIVALIAAVAALSIFTYYYGSDTIGSVFRKYEFQTQYYVHLFPEGSKSKNYLVPADLHIKGETIALEKVYWPNGGHTDFGNYDNYDCEEFYMEGHVTLKDNQGREWEVVLTKVKVKK